MGSLRACRLLLYQRSSYSYHPVVKDHRALILRLKELAFTRVRYGYRRLAILLQREGWKVGKRLVYRFYRQESLLARTKQRKKRARWQQRWRQTNAGGRWTSCPNASRTGSTSGC